MRAKTAGVLITAEVRLSPAHGLLCSARRSDLMTHALALFTLHQRLFWDKKVRIALLTLLTFAALC